MPLSVEVYNNLAYNVHFPHKEVDCLNPRTKIEYFNQFLTYIYSQKTATVRLSSSGRRPSMDVFSHDCLPRAPWGVHWAYSVIAVSFGPS